MTIKEKEEEMTERVFQRLSENNIKITMIFTKFQKDVFLREADGSRKDLLKTTFVEPILDKHFIAYSDPETLEMLYVQTAPTRFMEIEDFFKPREDYIED